MPEPSHDATPDGFAAGAAAGLSQVSGMISALAPDVDSGALTITDDAARQLLSALGQLHDRAVALAGGVDELQQPLHFGHNWVGYTMDSTLRGAASGRADSVSPVLTQFADLLDQLRTTVARAAGDYAATDAEAGLALNRAAVDPR
jgi:hypothetical protein